MDKQRIMMDNHTLRRAAVLVASLKPKQAQELIAQLSPHDTERLHACVAQLSEEDLATTEDVIEEFLDYHQEPIQNPQQSDSPIQTESEPLPASGQSTVPQPPHESAPTNPQLDFSFLDQVSPTLIADFLASVHGQIAAAVLAGLPSDFAGVILSYFDAAKQQEVLDRIAGSRECSTAHLQAAMLLLQDQLLQIDSLGQCQSPRPDTKALEIQAAAQSSFRNRTIRSLDTSGTDLGRLAALNQSAVPGTALEEESLNVCSRDLNRHAKASQQFTLRFEDLILLDDQSLAQVFHEIDTQIMLLALAGATIDFIKRISDPLTNSQKERFNRQLQTLGPISLAEIEQAQQNVAETATQLANAGKIIITSQQPFRAAA